MVEELAITPVNCVGVDSNETELYHFCPLLSTTLDEVHVIFGHDIKLSVILFACFFFSRNVQ